jgi:hypothetical protein
MNGETEEKRWGFYYALYSNLAHWTASLTILGFMITAGIVLTAKTDGGTTQPVRAAIAFGFLCLAEYYLGWRMIQLGPYIRKRLPP